MTPTEAYFVTRTVRALELLAFALLSAPQLAARLQIHARTARRMLRRLGRRGIRHAPRRARRRYALTPGLVALAGQALARDELILAAAPFVAALRDHTGLVAHLMVPSYDGALCLVHAAPGQALRRVRSANACPRTARPAARRS